MRNDKRNSNASAICDRTGVRYPMREMVIEPGTNWLVHKSVSDGDYSLVSHPLANMHRYLKGKTGDPFSIPNARPDISWHSPQVFYGKATLTGVGVVTANSYMSYNGAATLQGVGTLTATSLEVKEGSATLQGAGTLTVTQHDWLRADWNSSDWDS